MSCSKSHRIRRMAVGAVVAAGVAFGGLAFAGPAAASYPRVYVADANLRANPDTQSAVLATLNNENVEVVCWTNGENTNGTAKWFRIQYYNTVGYLNANTTNPSEQPVVDVCP